MIMANYNELKASIEQQIRSNGNQEITGAVLQAAMLNMVDVLGENAAWGGVITPTSTHADLNINTLYLASESGTYANFGGVTVEKDEIAAIYYNGVLFNKQVVMKVGQVLANLIGSSQEVLNMLAELAEYLAQDPNLATSLATALANKADRSSTMQGYGIINGFIVRGNGASGDNSADADDYYAAGATQCVGNVANTPAPYGTLIVLPGAGNYVPQLFIASRSGGFWYRSRNDYGWGEWHKISQE